ncbi:hypothetical protein IF2G_10371 [Cordyceps javanica]|nr:hypothetical protein IF2G_10371 [Cordyceps javanica]
MAAKSKWFLLAGAGRASRVPTWHELVTTIDSIFPFHGRVYKGKKGLVSWLGQGGVAVMRLAEYASFNASSMFMCSISSLHCGGAAQRLVGDLARASQYDTQRASGGDFVATCTLPTLYVSISMHYFEQSR